MTGRFLEKATTPAPPVVDVGPPAPAVADVRIGREVVTDIGDNKITPVAEGIRYATDEAMVWQERPSPLVLLPRALLYGLGMVVLVTILSALGSALGGGRHGAAEAFASRGPGALARTWFWRIELLVFVALLARLALAYISLSVIKYRATSQRLFVESGLFVSRSVPYEIHALGDAVVSGNILLKMFKIQNVTFETPAPIALVGLRNAGYVRDILRSGGQLEAQRADKIRWR